MTTWLLVLAAAVLSDEALRALVVRAMAGRADAVQALVARLAPVIQARVRRFLARCPGGRLGTRDRDDLMQDIWLTLIKDGGRQILAWDPTRGRSLESYVGLICERDLRHRLRHLNADRRAPEHVMTAPDTEPLTGGDDPEAALVGGDLMRALEAHLVAELPERGRVILRGLYHDGHTAPELAAALGVTAQVVYNWQHRIRELARAFLSAQTTA